MKRTELILIVLLAAVVGVIISMRGDASSYVPFNEARENPDRDYHVVGKLRLDKPMIYNPEVDANLFVFYLEDEKGETCEVKFGGTKPDNFEHADKVVIVGNATEKGAFIADKILTKCPSKYDKSQNAQGAEGDQQGEEEIKETVASKTLTSN